MGLQSVIDYSTLSWLPTLFRDRGADAVNAGTLLALMNLGNGITALLLPVIAHRTRDQRWLAAFTAIIAAVGLAGGAVAPPGGGGAGGVALRPGGGGGGRPGVVAAAAPAPRPRGAAPPCAA